MPAVERGQQVELTTPVTTLDAVLERLACGSRVTDVGCFGWTLAAACERAGHALTGVDRTEPRGRPVRATFATMEGSTLHVPDDSADLVVASHVLEHMADAIAFFGEIARVAAPGGRLWVESPSELSALGRSTDTPEDHSFNSFWDDPTHVRPWPPGALYRLALSWSCRPVYCGRGQAGDIPVSRLLAEKPQNASGRIPYSFVSLKDVPPGIGPAWCAANAHGP